MDSRFGLSINSVQPINVHFANIVPVEVSIPKFHNIPDTMARH